MRRGKVQVPEGTDIYALLLQCGHSITKVGQKEIKEAGITMTQAALLFVVKATDGPATLSEISRWLFRERHTVFALVKQMERQGLVTRVKDLKRKNAFRVVLTEKGEEAYRGAMAKEHVIPDVVSCLSQEERDNLRSCLLKLRDEALSRLGEPPRFPVP